MHASDKTLKIVAAALMLGGILFAQTGSSSSKPQGKKRAAQSAPASKSPSKAAAWRQQCSKLGGFCIEVPKDWQYAGEVFDGAGFVVAEPDKNKAEADWNQITAAATDMPDAQNGQERPTTDELIDVILGSPANGITTQTLQRSKLIVAGMPAERLKIRLRAAESDMDAIEYIALLDDGETIYSVALGCTPEDAARLEPTFERVLHSWKATPPSIPPEAPNPPATKPPKQ